MCTITRSATPVYRDCMQALYYWSISCDSCRHRPFRGAGGGRVQLLLRQPSRHGQLAHAWFRFVPFLPIVFFVNGILPVSFPRAPSLAYHWPPLAGGTSFPAAPATFNPLVCVCVFFSFLSHCELLKLLILYCILHVCCVLFCFFC